MLWSGANIISRFGFDKQKLVRRLVRTAIVKIMTRIKAI
jgi:hypothetical protein